MLCVCVCVALARTPSRLYDISRGTSIWGKANQVATPHLDAKFGPSFLSSRRNRRKLHSAYCIYNSEMATSENTESLLRFVADLTPESVPEDVWLRTEDLFLDWLASALASRNSHPISKFENLAKQLGPRDGTAQIFANGSTSSPYWAAWVNAASSHTLEQDDLHNSSVMHPATSVCLLSCQERED